MRELKKAFLRDAQAQQDALIRACAVPRDTRDEKKAFRKAVEANRDAQAQLDYLIRASAAPRDTYEETFRPREFERQPLRPKPARTFFISAIALAVLAFGIGGGGLFLADALKGPDDGVKVTEVTARGLSQRAASTGTTEQEEQPGKLEGAVVPSIAPASSTATGAAERGDVAGNTENGPAPSLPRSGVEVAKVTEDPGAATDQPDAKTTADPPEKSEGIERPGQNLNRARSAEVELSLERDKNAPQSSSSDHPTAGDNAIGNADAADTRSTDPKFYRERGMAFYRHGDLDRALADLDTAIQLDPRSASAYIDRSIVLYRKAEPNRAFADIAQAIRIEDSLKAAAGPHRPPAPPPKH
jgi:tetratricopeptide (TPR) repeat protein